MNFFDWIIIAILIFFSVKGVFRGAAREIFSLLALGLASLLSWRYYILIVPFLQPYIDNEWVQKIIASVALFFPVYILINITGWLISKLLKKIELGAMDKMGGALVGAAKAYIVTCCIIIIFMLLPHGSKFLKDSTLSGYCYPFLMKISNIFPDQLKGSIQEKTKELKSGRISYSK